MNTQPRLVMKDITKSFGGTLALHGVSLTVQPGEILGLIGENGAGKSTLMRILSGAITADAGEMQLDGSRYAPASPLQARRLGIRMIYQELSLAPQLTIRDNILLGSEPTWGPFIRPRLADKRVRNALELVGLGHLPPARRIADLTSPQQQLIEIARAIHAPNDDDSQSIACRVLVLDEPTSSLTREDALRLFHLIRKLRDQRVAVIYISHYLEEIRGLCDRYLVLRDGEVVGTGPIAGTSEQTLVTMMIGRQVTELYPRHSRSPGELLLNVQGLCGIHFPRMTSFYVHRGEIVGIFGLIGAGRTELMRALFGLDQISSGNLRVASNRSLLPRHNRWRYGLGMVSENRKQEGLALGLSVAENLVLPRLHGLGPAAFVWPYRARQASSPWIERLRIKCRSPEDPVQQLSGGNQQRVALARLLHAHVDLFLLDEPTRGVDVGSKQEIYCLLDEVTRCEASPLHKACGILMISSYMPELLGTCDRIAVMCRGELSEFRSAREWTEEELLLAAMGQLAKKP